MLSTFGLLLSLGAGLGAEPGWIADRRTGCQVWNPNPRPNESVTWAGACANGKAEGLGFEEWFEDGSPGATFSGRMSGGWMVGRGTYNFASGDTYVGDFKDDSKDGHGTYYWASGTRYEGEFKDGVRSGKGMLGPHRYCALSLHRKATGQRGSAIVAPPGLRSWPHACWCASCARRIGALERRPQATKSESATSRKLNGVFAAFPAREVEDDRGGHERDAPQRRKHGQPRPDARKGRQSTPSPPRMSKTAVAQRNPGDTWPIHGIFAARSGMGVASFQMPVPTKVSASSPWTIQSAVPTTPAR